MPEPFEIQVEREDGFTLQIGGKKSASVKPWQGWRVKYRALGSRGRWSKFLTEDDLTQFDTAALQAFCAAHEARG